MTDRYNRRTALAGLGGVSLAALLAACGGDEAATTSVPTPTVRTGADGTPGGLVARFDAAAACTQTAEQTEGPFYFEVDKIRADIREDRDGAPLRLGVRVRDLESCESIANAVVDVWHCDAGGLYSGFEAASPSGTGGGRSDEETYLRGAQITDGDGIVAFRTVYPGWYPGRTPHIHIKVHIDNTTMLTSQLYFADDVTAKVHANAPYATGGEAGNAADGLYDPELELTLSEEDDGWLGLITLDVRGA